jgi:hypothetical protein
MPATVFEHHPGPDGVSASPDFTLTVEGEPVFVYHTPVASVALITADRALDVEVRPAFPFEKAVVRPLSRGVTPAIADGLVRFTAPPTTPEAPTLLSLELDDELRRPLILLVRPPETSPPRPGDPDVLYLQPGKVHDLGRVELTSGQTLYIPGGTVLRGNVVARDAENVSIRGRGVIDGSGHTWETGGRRERLVHLAGCRNVRIEGVTLLDGRTWQVVPAGCDGVTIQNIAIVSGGNSDDGIDLVSSRDVLVEGCFIRTKDDCIAIKGVPDFHERAALPVRDVEVRRCVFWNAEWGNALEIGYETRVDEMTRIAFRDCDVIHCEAERYGSGGVLTIHNGDRAVISDVLYEDIRVEDAREKLVDFKISVDRYSRDAERGQIRDITLRNVRVVGGIAPVSILQGFDGEHLPGPITFEDVVIHDEPPMRDAASARLVTEKVRDVRFVVGGEDFPLRR